MAMKPMHVVPLLILLSFLCPHLVVCQQNSSSPLHNQPQGNAGKNGLVGGTHPQGEENISVFHLSASDLSAASVYNAYGTCPSSFPSIASADGYCSGAAQDTQSNVYITCGIVTNSSGQTGFTITAKLSPMVSEGTYVVAWASCASTEEDRVGTSPPVLLPRAVDDDGSSSSWWVVSLGGSGDVFVYQWDDGTLVNSFPNPTPSTNSFATPAFTGARVPGVTRAGALFTRNPRLGLPHVLYAQDPANASIAHGYVEAGNVPIYANAPSKRVVASQQDGGTDGVEDEFSFGSSCCFPSYTDTTRLVSLDAPITNTTASEVIATFPNAGTLFAFDTPGVMVTHDGTLVMGRSRINGSNVQLDFIFANGPTITSETFSTPCNLTDCTPNTDVPVLYTQGPLVDGGGGGGSGDVLYTLTENCGLMGFNRSAGEGLAISAPQPLNGSTCDLQRSFLASDEHHMFFATTTASQEGSAITTWRYAPHNQSFQMWNKVAIDPSMEFMWYYQTMPHRMAIGRCTGAYCCEALDISPCNDTMGSLTPSSVMMSIIGCGPGCVSLSDGTCDCPIVPSSSSDESPASRTMEHSLWWWWW